MKKPVISIKLASDLVEALERYEPKMLAYGTLCNVDGTCGCSLGALLANKYPDLYRNIGGGKDSPPEGDFPRSKAYRVLNIEYGKSNCALVTKANDRYLDATQKPEARYARMLRWAREQYKLCLSSPFNASDLKPKR